MRTLFESVLNRQWPCPDARGYRREWWSPPHYLGPLEAPADELYHYTTRKGWRAIQAAAELRPFRDYPEQPRPLEWLTTNPIYDFGCLKKLDLSTLAPGQVFDRRVQQYGPLYRVVVSASAEPLSYREVIRTDARHRQVYQTFFVDPDLREIDRHDWRCSSAPIPASVWLRGARWCPLRCGWVDVQEQTAV